MDKLSVLVVEDEPIVREMLKEMLFRVGAVNVVECGDASSALKTFKAQRFDIVMLDLGLPDRDGHALMQDLKSIHERQHIVLVTADDSLESIQKAISAGANGYVVKPYSEEKIQDVVNNYMMVHGIDSHLTRDGHGA